MERGWIVDWESPRSDIEHFNTLEAQECRVDCLPSIKLTATLNSYYMRSCCSVYNPRLCDRRASWILVSSCMADVKITTRQNVALRVREERSCCVSGTSQNTFCLYSTL